MLFSPQLPLPLEPRRALRLTDFVAGPNGAVVAAVSDRSQALGWLFPTSHRDFAAASTDSVSPPASRARAV